MSKGSLNFAKVSDEFLEDLNDVLKLGYVLARTEEEHQKSKHNARKEGLVGDERKMRLYRERETERLANIRVEEYGRSVFSKWCDTNDDIFLFMKEHLDIFSRNIGILYGKPEELKKNAFEKYSNWQRKINMVLFRETENGFTENTFFELALIIKYVFIESQCLYEDNYLLYKVNFDKNSKK